VTDNELTDLVTKSLFIGDSILGHDVAIRTRLRPPPPSFSGKGRFLLEIYLQNNTDTPTGRAYCLNKPCLLDVEFEAYLLAGQQIDVPHRLQPEDYRYQPEDGVAGYGVTCAVTKVAPQRFRTDSMPIFAQARVDAPTPKEVDMPLPATFKLLKDKPMEVLDGFLVALKNYNATWDAVEADLKAAGQTAELQEVQSDRAAYDREVALIMDGVKQLEELFF
jgi:hypothetical protein